MAGDRTDPGEQLRLGSVFGRYHLDGLVGRGGMGVVFRATDTSLNRPVALKVLSAALAAEPAFRARFERESRLAAAIEHPSIVPVYDAGAIDETLYIAMRYVPGRDLGTILRADAPLGFGRTLALMRPLAEALDAAHRRGLVHRDVKPGNVLVEQDGAERPYLADFGLTHRVGDATLATRAGPIGTIDYVAPEQVEGRPVDGRADQYGLACVVVHCLTGSPPFGGDSDAAVLYAHVNADPASVLAGDPRIPPPAADALTRALAKSPDARYPDCRTFVAALTGIGSPQTGGTGESASSTGPDGSTSPGAKRRPRHRHPLTVVAVLGVAAIVVASALLAAPPLGPEEPTIEPSPGASVPADGRLAAGVSAEPVVLGPTAGEVIYFASDQAGGYDIYALEPGERRPRVRRVTSDPGNERLPAVSPDGKRVAYVVGTFPTRDIWLMKADGSGKRPLVTHGNDDTDPTWSADGRSIAFASQRSDRFYDIWEIPDRGSGFRERDARQITDRQPALEEQPDWAPVPGSLVIASNFRGQNRDAFIIDSGDGEVDLRLTTTWHYDLNPSWAPDGDLIAFERRPFCATCLNDRGRGDLFTIPAEGGQERWLTDTPTRDEIEPDWAPDSRAIVYAAGQPGEMELFVMTPDRRERKALTTAYANAAEPSWGSAPQRPIDGS